MWVMMTHRRLGFLVADLGQNQSGRPDPQVSVDEEGRLRPPPVVKESGEPGGSASATASGGSVPSGDGSGVGSGVGSGCGSISLSGTGLSWIKVRLLRLRYAS